MRSVWSDVTEGVGTGVGFGVGVGVGVGVGFGVLVGFGVGVGAGGPGHCSGKAALTADAEDTAAADDAPDDTAEGVADTSFVLTTCTLSIKQQAAMIQKNKTEQRPILMAHIVCSLTIHHPLLRDIFGSTPQRCIIQKENLSAKYSFRPLIAMRSCSIVSRSRTVTIPSSSESKS